ncbi:transient receptor potential cation channel subfamily M member 4-like, partial [Saccostrea cucullata]|uniref:transient receptor potential cation channel subfamily M member 4-like n=1 Tax=Saccostrea cuccullata TaxID=36930 RepID=UPI002ED19FDD
MARCASELGLHLAPYMKAMYAVITIILLLNLLIAMYSHTFEEVHEKSKFYWSQLQTDFLEEFSVKSVFPMHLQLIALPACLVHFILWCIIHFLRQKFINMCGGVDNDGDDVDNASQQDQDLEDANERPKSSEIDHNVKADEPKSQPIEIHFKDKGKKLNRSPMFVR